MVKGSCRASLHFLLHPDPAPSKDTGQETALKKKACEFLLPRGTETSPSITENYQSAHRLFFNHRKCFGSPFLKKLIKDKNIIVSILIVHFFNSQHHADNTQTIKICV